MPRWLVSSFSAALLSALLFGPSGATASGALHQPPPSALFPAVQPLQGRLLAQRAILPADETRRGTPDAHVAPAGRESPAAAGLLSLAVPGAGQLYNGDNLGYLFLGVEAAAWIMRTSMHSTGKDTETQYKKYADAHWSWERYRDPNSGPCTADGHSDMGMQDSTLVLLYDTRRDDWYEDIGKLSIYSCGWDDPQSRNVYRDMRADSNFFLRNARYATSVLFLNHLFSALHAARGAANHNTHLVGDLDIDFRWSPSLYNPSASVTLSQRF